MKHTPGPWIYDKRKERLISSNGTPVVVWNAGLAFGQRTEETEANGVLIGAAPKLLDACIQAQAVIEAMHRVHPDESWLGSEYLAIKAAIVEAEPR